MKNIITTRSYNLILVVMISVIVVFSLAACPTAGDDDIDKSKQILHLKDYSQYIENLAIDQIQFTYATSDDINLTLLKNKYNLEAVAGSGNEIEKIISLMAWVHKTIPHNGNASNPFPPNSIKILSDGKPFNCRMISTVLNEVYLAMGFSSRILTCMPIEYPPSDCHVVNMVYSRTLNKWLLMDASFEMYFLDENNTILSPEEIRYRYINDMPVHPNDNVNRNGKPLRDWAEAYLIQNLIWFNVHKSTGFSTEETNTRDMIALVPVNYSPASSIPSDWIVVSDPKIFWQEP